MNYKSKIELVENLIREITSNCISDDINDIRNVTNYSLYLNTENFLFGLIQSEQFFELTTFKKQIHNEFEQVDVDNRKFTYEGFLKNAFFITFFVTVESHIRHIAKYFEKNKDDINVKSIKTTFKNITKSDKTPHFSSLEKKDIELFNFYCYLRNTMHEIGFQSESNPNQSLIIEDLDSVITKNRTELKLNSGSENKIDLKELLLIQEQIFKLLNKINKLIPKEKFIKHKLVDVGFNG